MTSGDLLESSSFKAFRTVVARPSAAGSTCRAFGHPWAPAAAPRCAAARWRPRGGRRLQPLRRAPALQQTQASLAAEGEEDAEACGGRGGTHVGSLKREVHCLLQLPSLSDAVGKTMLIVEIADVGS